MKRLLCAALLAAGILFSHVQVHAIAALDLSGSSYSVFILCADDVGDFCSKGNMVHDRFAFDGDSFAINSFEEDWGGFAGSGSFSAGGFSFSANYTAIKDLTTSYEFTIRGLSFVDMILLGTIDITYSEPKIAIPPIEETSGSAFFFGIKG